MTDGSTDEERTVVERVDARLGRVLRNRYRIDHKLAAGGFGSVYRATDLQRRSPVAIKVLHPELVRDPDVVTRFRREASALASLRDAHTVHALDAGEEPDGTLYIVMELLGGESLYEHFKSRGPLGWQRMVAIARCVCSSLAEAHALGIVHRDLKPANIHLEANDHAKVLDFGIAKILDTSTLIGGDLTQVGQMIGTYDYMPPEQMIGTCTPESDVFTLGVVIYEMISGKRPFGEARGPAAQLANVIGTTPEPLANVPPELARIVARCIAREAADRYHDARVLAAELGAVLLAHHFAVGTSDESLDDVLDRLGEHRERPTTASDGFDNPAFASTALAAQEATAAALPIAPESDRTRALGRTTSPITPPEILGRGRDDTSVVSPITPTTMFDRARTSRPSLPGLPPVRPSAHELPTQSAHELPTQLAAPITPLPPTPVPRTPTPPRPVPLAGLDMSARVPRSFMPNATLLGVLPPAAIAHGSSDTNMPRRFATGTTPTADVLASDSATARPPTGDELARRPSSTGFDLERQARRDAMVRLAVWVALLAAITIAAWFALH